MPVTGVCVVAFDVRLGPVVRFMHPKGCLSEIEQQNVGGLSFPISNSSNQQQSCTFAFRFRRRKREGDPNDPASSNVVVGNTFLFATCQYILTADASVERGFLQQSVIILATEPLHALYAEALGVLCDAVGFERNHGELDEKQQELARTAAQEMIQDWPSVLLLLQTKQETSSNNKKKQKKELTLLGHVLVAEQKQEPPETEDHKHGDVKVEMPPLRRTVSLQDSVQGGEDAASLLSEFADMKLFSTFQSCLFHLWTLWEIVLTGKPLLVFAATPWTVSTVIRSLCALIQPLPYLGDYRPYFTIYDPDYRHFKQIYRLNPSSLPAIVLGVTNPFILNELKLAPHVLFLGTTCDPSAANFEENRENAEQSSSSSSSAAAAAAVASKTDGNARNIGRKDANSLRSKLDVKVNSKLHSKKDWSAVDVREAKLVTKVHQPVFRPKKQAIAESFGLRRKGEKHKEGKSPNSSLRPSPALTASASPSDVLLAPVLDDAPPPETVMFGQRLLNNEDIAQRLLEMEVVARISDVLYAVRSRSHSERTNVLHTSYTCSGFEFSANCVVVTASRLFHIDNNHVILSCSLADVSCVLDHAVDLPNSHGSLHRSHTAPSVSSKSMFSGWFGHSSSSSSSRANDDALMPSSSSACSHNHSSNTASRQVSQTLTISFQDGREASVWLFDGPTRAFLHSVISRHIRQREKHVYGVDVVDTNNHLSSSSSSSSAASASSHAGRMVIRNALLCKHFVALTEAFLRPFRALLHPRFDALKCDIVNDDPGDMQSVYIRHMGISRISGTAVLKYVDTHFQRVCAHFPNIFVHLPSRQALLQLYQEFIHSPNYVPWYNTQFEEARERAFGELCDTLDATNGELTTTAFASVTPARLDKVTKSVTLHWKFILDRQLTRETCERYDTIREHYVQFHGRKPEEEGKHTY